MPSRLGPKLRLREMVGQAKSKQVLKLNPQGIVQKDTNSNAKLRNGKTEVPLKRWLPCQGRVPDAVVLTACMAVPKRLVRLQDPESAFFHKLYRS